MPQQINLDQDVTLTLKPNELTTIINHLRQGTYANVEGTLNSIERQVIMQVQQARQAQVKAAKPEELETTPNGQ